MAEEKLTEKEIKSRIKELKIEMLKQVMKRKDIKREIARLLTLKPKKAGLSKEEINKSKTQTKK